MVIDSIGSRIRNMRKAKLVTQEKLADMVGVTRSAVAQWETDRVMPGRPHLNTLATLFDCSVSFLLSGEVPTMSTAEAELVSRYRTCSAEDRKVILLMAKRLANT
jgi:transcriptional regulator with XRE-family HTH domain